MRGTKYPMIVMAMDQANISAKELCARCGMSVSAFQNKMRKTVQNSKERAFSLDECYLILEILGVPKSKIFEYMPPETTNDQKGLHGNIAHIRSHRRAPAKTQ